LIALATNADDSHEKEIREALKRVRINCFIKCIYCSNDIGVRKPSPQFYNFIAKDLSLMPREMVMIGDNLHNDIYGALHAGLQALWYSAVHNSAEVPQNVRCFNDFRQLRKLLQEMNA
jgi:putative hydrolase of the HAD superfamily